MRMNDIGENCGNIDALLPREMAERAERVGVDKARLASICPTAHPAW